VAKDPENIDLFGGGPRDEDGDDAPPRDGDAGSPDRANLAQAPAPDAPLADRMRPRTLDELAGQAEALRPGGFLRRAIEDDKVPSLILWGPPGCGKTSLANVVAHHTRAHVASFSAVLGGIKEVRALIAEAEARRRTGTRTILFVDEIHRFNKAQQDGFLPHVESGTIRLIGATTENPSFALNNALLSRCRVVTLKALDDGAVSALVARALVDEERGLGALHLEAAEGFTMAVAMAADGDARRALNLLEQAADMAASRGQTTLDVKTLGHVLAQAPARYDRDGDAHYDNASAFIKSMRGSSPDAALFYAARMLEAGEEPLFLLRRILIFASEDIGNADPRALQVALAAFEAFERLGMPEGKHPIAQAITYCATAPKSNASYAAWEAARADALAQANAPVPDHLRNAPTALARSLGHAKGYVYPHDRPGHFVRTEYLPERIAGRRYYRPTGQGYERHILDRLKAWWGFDD
jgi:putative ATPase